MRKMEAKQDETIDAVLDFTDKEGETELEEETCWGCDETPRCSGEGGLAPMRVYDGCAG